MDKSGQTPYYDMVAKNVPVNMPEYTGCAGMGFAFPYFGYQCGIETDAAVGTDLGLPLDGFFATHILIVI